MIKQLWPTISINTWIYRPINVYRPEWKAIFV